MENTPGTFAVKVLSQWPTIVARNLVDGHENFDADLQALAGGGIEGDVFATENPAVNWLREKINDRVHAYFEHFTDVEKCAWRLQGRLVVRRLNEFQALNNKPGRYLSGVYFASAPPRNPALRLRQDVLTNAITLLDPRFGMNMNSINGDPYVGQLREVPAEAGLLMMWPAFVNHWTTPNHSDEPLVAVEFDVITGTGEKPETATWQRIALKAPDPAATALKDAFVKMWPTFIMQRKLDDGAEWNGQLISLATTMEEKNETLTTDYQGVDFFAINHPAVNWLGDRIRETVSEYLANFVNFDVNWFLQGWPNINRIGD